MEQRRRARRGWMGSCALIALGALGCDVAPAQPCGDGFLGVRLPESSRGPVRVVVPVRVRAVSP